MGAGRRGAVWEPLSLEEGGVEGVNTGRGTLPFYRTSITGHLGWVLLEEGEGRARNGFLFRAVSHGNPGGCRSALSAACDAGSFQGLGTVAALAFHMPCDTKTQHGDLRMCSLSS